MPKVAASGFQSGFSYLHARPRRHLATSCPPGLVEKRPPAVNVLGFQEGREFAANAEAVRVQTLGRRRLRTPARPGRLVAAEARVKIGRRGS